MRRRLGLALGLSMIAIALGGALASAADLHGKTTAKVECYDSNVALLQVNVSWKTKVPVTFVSATAFDENFTEVTRVTREIPSLLDAKTAIWLSMTPEELDRAVRIHVVFAGSGQIGNADVRAGGGWKIC